MSFHFPKAQKPRSSVLYDAGLPGPISGVVFMAATEAAQPEILLDDLTLQPDTSLPAAPAELTVAVTVDVTADRHPISPYIYGMAYVGREHITDLRLTSNRLGGNPTSRYNWVHGNACNAARDWRWANRILLEGNFPPGPSSAADHPAAVARRETA